MFEFVSLKLKIQNNRMVNKTLRVGKKLFPILLSFTNFLKVSKATVCKFKITMILVNIN